MSKLKAIKFWYSIKLSCRFILLLLLFAQGKNTLAQNFNKSVEGNVDILGAKAMVSINQSQDSFLLFGSGIKNGRLNVQPFLLNVNGDTLSGSIIIDSIKQYFVGWSNPINKTNDNHFIMGGGLAVDTFDYGYLVKYNKFGDTLWSKTFGDTIDFYTFRQARQAQDGGYVAVGESSYPHGSFSDGWLVKTDSNGVLQWQKFYGQLNQTERLTSVFPTQDGGYILGGARRHFAGSPPRHNLDPLIIKVDSAGNQEWMYVYDTPYNEAVAYVIQTMDGNFVFGSSISVSQAFTTCDGDGKATLFKVSSTGTLMWTKSYGFVSANHGFQCVKELADSSLIAVGRRREDTSALIKGLMVKTKANGDSIFVKTYEHDVNGTKSQNYLWDVIPMHDGGFMACGEVIGIPPQVPFRQDAWVIRVDSNGCILANCLVGNEGLKLKDEGLKIYPNPTNGLLTIESEKNFSRIEVYNLQGQKVMEVSPSQNQFELPEESGLYLVRLTSQEGELLNKKVVKR